MKIILNIRHEKKILGNNQHFFLRLYPECPQDYTVNVYRYKAIGANATISVISTTWKCICPCLEIL